MVDMTHRLHFGELLRATHVPAMSAEFDTQQSGWQITLRTNGELTCHRNNSALIAAPSILLSEDEMEALILELNLLAIDYEPNSTCDGTEYRYLTYMSNAHCYHITYVDGISHGFDRRFDFDRIWRRLDSLACQVGFGPRMPR